MGQDYGNNDLLIRKYPGEYPLVNLIVVDDPGQLLAAGKAIVIVADCPLIEKPVSIFLSKKVS